MLSNHHEGRKWSLTLSLMALKTGAFREVKTAYPMPHGGHNMDGTNFLIPEGRMLLPTKLLACVDVSHAPCALQPGLVQE